MVLLEAEGLRKSYRVRSPGRGGASHRIQAVDGVSVGLDAGETLAVVGESGSGKSTLARLVVRLIEPDEGRITFDGTDLRALSRRQLRQLRPRFQMIFQDPFSSLDPRMVIGDQVAEPLKVHGICSGAAVRRARALELLHTVGLREDQYDRFPYEFSGGQLQRATIARALATDPRMIVCDEPVAALDVSIRAQVINLLRDIQRTRRIGLLFISHDLSLVRHVADRVAVMHHGVVVESGATEDVFTEPRDQYTKDLLRAVPVADPRRSRRFMSTGREAWTGAEAAKEPLATERDDPDAAVVSVADGR